MLHFIYLVIILSSQFIWSVLFCEQGVCGCERFSSSSTGEVIRAIIKRDGYAGLMRGWKPRMLFHAPAAAICWSTYEASKSFFHRLNQKNTIVWGWVLQLYYFCRSLFLSQLKEAALAAIESFNIRAVHIYLRRYLYVFYGFLFLIFFPFPVVVQIIILIKLNEGVSWLSHH